MKYFAALCLLSVSLYAGITCSETASAEDSADFRAIVATYADIAHAVYSDAHQQARDLLVQNRQLVKQPSEQALQAARNAWLAARIPYQQSEVFRFGNAPVDAWEGQVNAWPLDEGLIDYVAAGYFHEMGNVAATANIIAHPTIMIGATPVDASKITPDLLAELNELAGSEVNVTTGYHAIEFLLWGQDLNGTGPGAGERPYTDYVTGEQCTHGNCDRRGDYLVAATELLVQDLAEMVAHWQPGQAANYRAELLAEPAASITKMLYGMGSLSLGELAGERMKVALEAASTEDEHDCFSDNTHNSHYYNALGIDNIYFGRYRTVDGKTVSGPALHDWLEQHKPELAKQAEATFGQTQTALTAMKQAAERAKAPMKFDQMIAEGNEAGSRLITDAMATLVEQTRTIEQIAAAVGVNNLNPDAASHHF